MWCPSPAENEQRAVFCHVTILGSTLLVRGHVAVLSSTSSCGAFSSISRLDLRMLIVVGAWMVLWWDTVAAG